jgi:type II secretory pathway pseudopilin PulG
VNKHGFTIIEVVLFLAITALLGFIAIIGLGPRFRNVRFSESMRDLETNIQKELINSRAVNSRPNLRCTLTVTGPLDISATGSLDNPGEAEDCVLNGRLLVFNPDNTSYQYHTIVSRREPLTGCLAADPSVSNLLDCYQATVVGSTLEIRRFGYLNGVQKTTSPTADTAVIYFQDPGTGRQFLFGYGTGPYTSNTLLSIAAPPTPLPTPYGPCLTLGSGSGNRIGEVQFTTNVLTPKLEFGDCT